jgi:hypothetical protein
MTTKKRVSARERAYLDEEDATELWALLREETCFNRRPVKRRGADEEYNHRLLYLMAAAVFRSMQRLVPQRRWRRLLDTVESYADGEATFDELMNAYDAGSVNTPNLPAANAAAAHCTHLLPDDYKVLEGVDFVSDAAGYLAAVAAGVLKSDEGLGMTMPVWKEPAFQNAKRAHERRLCALIRDIFGNPYRPPPAIDHAWLAWNDGAIPNMARTMYASKRFRDLPILGDALEEAGFADEALLGHCRGPGPHVRGCWALDLILAKE